MKITRKINGKAQTFTLTSAERYAAFIEQDKRFLESDIETVMKDAGYKVGEIKQVLKDETMVALITRKADKASEFMTYPEHIEFAIEECKEQIRYLLSASMI